jgi:hypothetical protein
MSKFWITLVAVPIFQFALANTAFADAAAEKYIDDALPLMYHSCKSVVDEAAGDQAYITKVISALVAVSLYNHEVDITKHVKSESEKTALSKKFIADLVKQCKKDKEALLAGAIDDAVVSALASK